MPDSTAATWRNSIRDWRQWPLPGSLANTAILCLLLGAAYLFLGQLAFAMAVQNANITCLAFFPEGVSLVCVIIFGPRVAPGIFLGQFILAQWTGLSPSASALIGVNNSIEAIIGGWLFRRWRISPLANRPRDIVLMTALIALVLQPLSATGGISAQYFFTGVPAPKLPEIWLYWWAGNTLGQTLVLPLILSWITRPASPLKRHELRNALVIVAAYVLLLVVFSLAAWTNLTVFRLFFFAAFYLTLIGVAVQSHVRTVAITNLLMTGPFLWMINSGPDLLAFFSAQNKLLCADVFLMGGLVTALLLAALWEQLNDGKRALAEANAAKEKLFSVIGHDLRGPVSNLTSALDLLLDGSITPERFAGYQLDLRKRVDRVHSTLENLMEWGAFQQSAIRPRAADLSLRDSAAEAVQLMTWLALEKRITIENTIPAGARVHADAHQIQSVFRNLLSNALKFTPRRGSIVLSATQHENGWLTAIRDNGVGMAPEDAARLFQTQGEFLSTPGTENESGLGLGLQICHDFITANHGSIRVESAVGSGTTFHFLLPGANSNDT